MKLPALPNIALYVGLGAGALAVVYVGLRKAAGDTRGVAEIIAEVAARGAVSAAQGAAVGAVKGAGSLVGIPDTDATRCAAAKAAGDTWGASKYCPASDFLSWSASRVFGREQTAQEAARPLLSLGSTGAAVRELQGLLGLARDGIFGRQTEAAVMAYQRSVGLMQDGIVGPATWAALDSGRAVVTQSGTLISGADRDLIR